MLISIVREGWFLGVSGHFADFSGAIVLYAAHRKGLTESLSSKI